MRDFFTTFLAAVADVTDPLLSVAPWITVLTGSGGALVAMALWVRSLIADKREMLDRHKDKDDQLVSITREAIACIQSSLVRADIDSGNRDRLESILVNIERLLSELSSQNPSRTKSR